MKLAALIVVSLSAVARADEFGALREAMQSARFLAQQANGAARAAGTMDIFSLDLAKAPDFIKAEIEKQTKAKAGGWKPKQGLRLEIARLQNTIDETFEQSKQSCQMRLDSALAKHAQAGSLAAQDMGGIHAAIVKLRDDILAALNAGKGKQGSIADKIVSDHQALAALRRLGTSVDEASRRASDASQMSILQDLRLILSPAKATIEAEAQARGLENSDYQNGYDKEPRALVLLDQKEPILQVCAPYYEHKTHVLSYKVCARVELTTGAKAGDTLADSMKLDATGRSSAALREPVAQYATSAVSDCVSLEAAQRALAILP